MSSASAHIESVRHIENFARDLYRRVAKATLDSCQVRTKELVVIPYLGMGSICSLFLRFMFSYVEVAILINVNIKSKTKRTINIFFIVSIPFQYISY